jgi:DHA2 family multidrug resistance protein-like MFS transporter
MGWSLGGVRRRAGGHSVGASFAVAIAADRAARSFDVFSLSVVTSVASFAAQMLAFVSLPFFFESVLHRTQVETGLLMTSWPLIGRRRCAIGGLADRVSPALLSATGLIVLCLGLALLADLPANASSGDLVWRMALCGLGFGFFQAPNKRSMLSAAPLERSGAAGGMLATARLTGQGLHEAAHEKERSRLRRSELPRLTI